MDRMLQVALVVFVALAVVGIYLTASPTTFVSAPGDVDALRLVGASMFTAGLASFLVEVYRWGRNRA